MWIEIIMVSALSGASGINISLRLGKLDPTGAKQAGCVGIVLSLSILMLQSTGIYLKPN